MTGESQMKKFMETVEAVTDRLERAVPHAESQEQMEVSRDMDAADWKETEEEDEVGSTVVKGQPGGADGEPLRRLIMKGAEFLMNLHHALAQGSASPREVVEKQMEAMIGKDEATGKSYLKVPRP